ncbi:diaminopimelate decarboxylase [Congregibacter litoralis]|uniref:Diaminopimelate decarboxylase n=1 Tax=Congregibacter litoralis KT71 TaxID=314285 RepID=A4A9F3_9GAMM|nr:diaminopimelate decarboxylase [Congregibacter litoralis]EAQ97120.1 diaminopimelate decarboxylase [Congregibacter litoralis KT71]
MGFSYREGRLFAEELDCETLAEEYGTPCYLYSRAAMEAALAEYHDALSGCEHLVCYAVKANSNLAVLDTLARQGAGFDIVSVGELERVLAAGGDPGKVVFSGVVKRREEMHRALELGIRCFNVESEAELEVLQEVAAALGKRAPVSVRVNPDVDAGTHPYISTGLRENKFGVATDVAMKLLRHGKTLPNIDVIGLDCHIGSQLTDMAPLLESLRQLLVMVDTLEAEGIRIHHLDLGGGIGVRYKDEEPPAIADYIAAVRKALGDRKLCLVFEPGRSIVANAGVLLTRVHYTKETDAHSFALVDAAMNDFIRPALYQAWVDIQTTAPSEEPIRTWNIVGPVCETGDFLGKDRDLALAPGTLLAIHGAGAYGFVMSSNYNTRPRAAEVMIDGSSSQLVRERESIGDLLRGEHRLRQ